MPRTAVVRCSGAAKLRLPQPAAGMPPAPQMRFGKDTARPRIAVQRRQTGSATLTEPAIMPVTVTPMAACSGRPALISHTPAPPCPADG